MAAHRRSHFFFTLNQRAIEPPGETVSNAELFRRLATTFGFTEPQFSMSEAELMEWYLGWESPKLGGMGHSPTFSDNLVQVGLAQ